MRRFAALIVAAVALAVIPTQAEAVVHVGSPCDTEIRPRFYNFDQVDIAGCQ